jgi:hypothetical protein
MASGVSIISGRMVRLLARPGENVPASLIINRGEFGNLNDLAEGAVICNRAAF